jgi:hypothetical protein
VARLCHVRGADAEDDRLAAALADFGGGGQVRAEVDVVTGTLFQAFAADRVEELRDRAVVEMIGRRSLLLERGRR